MERLRNYKIVGDLRELENAMTSDALVMTSMRDVLSVLSEDRTNYVEIGYGQSLTEAYSNASVKECTCRLVHIFYSKRYDMNFRELSDFVSGMGNVIFGYSVDEKLENGVKIVALSNICGLPHGSKGK